MASPSEPCCCELRPLVNDLLKALLYYRSRPHHSPPDPETGARSVMHTVTGVHYDGMTDATLAVNRAHAAGFHATTPFYKREVPEL